jgi:hypothetical protein
VAGGLLGRLRDLIGGRPARSKPEPQPPEDPRRDAAQRLEAARDRLKQEIPPPEDEAAAPCTKDP